MVRNSPLVVGVDLATAEVRAVAADSEGNVRAESRQPLPAPTAPRPGWSEQDPQSWWPATEVCVSRLCDRLGARRNAIVALSVSATSGTVVALDDRDEPVAPALTYADQRAGTEAEELQAAAAGRWNELGVRIRPSFGLPKWAWLLRRRDLAAISHLAHAPDLLVARLVGEPVAAVPTDWSHALKSGYDAQRGEWVDDAMAAAGIPMGLLPAVRPPGTPVGHVTRDGSAATGLPAGCEVRLGMTDSCAAQLAAGAASPGRFVSVLGTTLVIKGASRQLVSDPGGAVYSHRHPDGWWLPGGASSTGARALTEGRPPGDLPALDEQAAGHGPAGVVAYPLVGRGERFPFAAPDAKGFTLGEPADDVDRYRALLEGVAFVERLGYERLAALGAPAQPPVAVAGGGSRSRVWNRIRSTVLGTPVVETPGATTALGACIFAAAGTLHPDLATATATMAATGEQVDPDPAEQDALERSYVRFVEALADRGWVDPAFAQ